MRARRNSQRRPNARYGGVRCLWACLDGLKLNPLGLPLRARARPGVAVAIARQRIRRQTTWACLAGNGTPYNTSSSALATGGDDSAAFKNRSPPPPPGAPAPPSLPLP
uniref:Uncharacterized protein n=1 Tax=Setaria viridis TaxID=4556 RepID=A0A4V6DF02_SETVI|nr:hypothetical protein SEVIR_2G408900v2 [Setaria viridis]